MRKIALFIAILFAFQYAVAQDWTPVDSHRYNDETVVYARLSTGDATVDNDPSRFTVGAFIDGECRAAANAVAASELQPGEYLYVLRVYGDSEADKLKPITFAVYDRTISHEFQVVPSRTVFFTGESEGTPSECILLSFNAHFVELQGFNVSVPSLCAGDTGALTLTPIPADATIPIDEISLRFSGLTDQWTLAEYSLASTAPVVFDVTPQIPGNMTVTVLRNGTPLADASGNTSHAMPVGARLRLDEGWQWLTNAYGHVATDDFVSAYGGDALVEIRTQEHLLYNDPSWGYFGTLMHEGLPQDKAYKVRMAAASQSGTLWNGSYVDDFQTVANPGWTWIPTPYYYNRRLSTALADTQVPNGMAIISKDSGSAEWDGTEWYGDLATLPAGESFLCYNPLDYAVTLHFAPELSMPQGNDIVEAPTATAPWTYDASQWRDNMTVVASMPDLMAASDYLVGAFVGDECRGQGRYVDGLFFITIHGRSGERVAFRLCHYPSGRQYAIDETVVGQLRIGTLDSPLILHSSEQATGIRRQTVVDADTLVVYDILGRRLPTDSYSGQARVTLQRLADGSFRKVVR